MNDRLSALAAAITDATGTDEGTAEWLAIGVFQVLATMRLESETRRVPAGSQVSAAYRRAGEIADREEILARFAPPGPSPRPDDALSHQQVNRLLPGEDGTDDPDDPDPAFDYEAAALLPACGERMNPAHPEGAMFYDREQVAYVVRQVSPEDPEGRWGAVRVLTSFGRLRGWTLGSEHEIRHDQTFRPLGRWVVTGIRNYKTGWPAGEIPDRPLRQWVFKLCAT